MLKDKTTVIGIGLAGETVGMDFQIRNYTSYLMNGSTQDNQTLTGAKNVMVLEGYDGLAGDRSLALEALKKNAPILKKLSEIENQMVICIASGGGSTGSGTIPYICDIVSKPSNIVVAVLLMPRPDEPIQKRLNAYNAAKELMETESIGAIIFVDNAAYPDLKKVNTMLGSIDTISYDEDYEKAVKDFEAYHKGYVVYHAIESITPQGKMLALLYTGDAEEIWDAERLEDNYLMAYVVNFTVPEYSEFGDICIEGFGDSGALVRVDVEHVI